MLYIYEFEVFQSEGYLVAIPFDFDGATQGRNEKEVAEMAADWLKLEIEYRLIDNQKIPEASFGNEPQKGGRSMIVAVEASLDTINAVQAYQAADMLKVSRGRVSQMLSVGLLKGFRKGRDAFITLDSINARLNEMPKVGRPRQKTELQSK